MIQIERLSPLVGTIYDAGADSSRWQDVVNGLVPLCGGKIALTLHDQVTGQPAFLVTANWEEDWSASYINHYSPLNPWTANLHKVGVGKVAHDEAMTPKDAIRGTEFYADWLQPQRLESATAAVVFNDKRRFFNLSAMHESERFRDESVRVFEILMPHLQRSAQLARQFETIEDEREAAAMGLESSATGMLVVDHNGRIVHANGLADKLLGEANGILAISGRLTASHGQQAQRLAALINAAAEMSAGMGLGSGGTISVPRRGRPPLTLLVAPFRSRKGLLADDRPTAIVFIRAPEMLRNANATVLESCFDLTAAEATLVLKLVQGMALEVIAAELDLSLNTVRTQLKSAMVKTGTRRQGELIALILKSAPPFQNFWTM